MTSRAAGFSLIELMVTVAIMGILLVIAVPSYSNYVYRTNRAVAKTALMKIYAQQEAWYNDRKSYTGLDQLTGYGATTVYLKKDGSTTTSSTDTTTIYSLTMGAYSTTTLANCSITGTPGTTSYAILATPVNTQANDRTCGRLCLDHQGNKTGMTNPKSPATPAVNADCWNR